MLSLPLLWEHYNYKPLELEGTLEPHRPSFSYLRQGATFLLSGTSGPGTLTLPGLSFPGSHFSLQFFAVLLYILSVMFIAS